MAFTWKVVFLGESSVGKTSIITRYITGQFLRDNATIGAAFISHQLKISSEHIVQLEIWDTAGQERYRSLTTMYYRNTNVAIVVFDLSNFHIDATLNDIDIWIEKLYEYNNIPNNDNDKLNIIIVGNKIDLLEENDDMLAIRETMLRYLDIKKNQDYNNIVLKYLEVSAKTGENVSNLFENVIVDLIPKDKLYFNDNNNNNNIISLGIDSKKDKYIKNRQCNC
ncbi:Rab family GTPase YPT10 PWA37_003418 [Arxiozyma heterogenica]|uniref:Uncharacterized protein n=1 Tax=Arxiozyma heterogenica TaxID=278026 RepID=A0AAN8A978_9SACH|nr:hypothetical protein RI543_001887 [Kazachstania heterogenica]